MIILELGIVVFNSVATDSISLRCIPISLNVVSLNPDNARMLERRLCSSAIEANMLFKVLIMARSIRFWLACKQI